MTKLQELQKAIDETAEAGISMLRKSQMALDFSSTNPHHAAYTRTNASGTVSQIQAKGTQHAHEEGRRAGTIGLSPSQNPYTSGPNADAWHEGHGKGFDDWQDASDTAKRTKEYETIKADAETRRQQAAKRAQTRKFNAADANKKYADAETAANQHQVGDTVHMGFGTKGGAGIVGKVEKIDGETVHIKNDEGRTFKGHISKVSKP